MTNTPRYQTFPPVEMDSTLVKELADSIQKTDLFGKLGNEDVEKLTRQMIAVEIPEGNALYVESEPADFMSLLVSGRLVVMKETEKGKSRQIADIMPGKSVGEMSMVDGKNHSATVVAGDKSIVAILSRAQMEKIVADDPELGARLFRSIAETISLRLRSTNNVLAQYLD
jgi:CRP/FNR family cyclic AMP-dependent transcriptional regulator